MRSRNLLLVLSASLLVSACVDPDPAATVGPSGASAFSVMGCELAVTDAEALAEIAALIAMVDALEADGALNSGQARALRNHLNNARRHIEAGRYCPAVAQLQTFEQQLLNFVRAGFVSDEQAAPLLAGVRRILVGEAPGFVVSALAAASNHTCALDAVGRAYCWGSNLLGRLGDGTTTDRLTPAPVSGGYGFLAIATRTSHSCALRADGSVYCWGNNSSGQIGDGSQTPSSPRLVPTRVDTDEAYTVVAVGDQHSCALTPDARVECWGDNHFGELGDGSGERQLRPVPVAGSFQTIGAGLRFTCALASDGRAFCWGRNDLGQLGDGTAIQRSEPTAVDGGRVFSSLAVGANHACALTPSGQAYCWGQFWGNTPVAVSGELTFASVSAGAFHSCGLDAAGVAYCWGFNDSGQLGDGGGSGSMQPRAVSGEYRFALIEAGSLHTCGAAMPAGIALCWGSNQFGQLGDGTTENRLVPTALPRP